MTTIALFGGTGRTGRRVLDRSLAAGYDVRMLARNPSGVGADRDHLTVVAGDVLDPGAVDETLAGADAVISVFGQVKDSPATLQEDGTRAIVNGMQRRGIRRIISLSGGGLHDPHDRPKVADRVIRLLLRTFAGTVLADAEAHLTVLRASDLDWTVVRGPRLTEGPAAGRYRVGWVGVGTGTQISRDDLADFIMTQVDDDRFRHALPFVSA
jgi:putative NADH-flavin reductase